jgi:peptidoglycan hydrolase CwlO-like protein
VPVPITAMKLKIKKIIDAIMPVLKKLPTSIKKNWKVIAIAIWMIFITVRILDDAWSIKWQIRDINSQVSDIYGIKLDVGSIESDVSRIKSDVSEVKSNMYTTNRWTNESLLDIIQRIDAKVKNLESKIEDLRRAIKDLK